MIFIEKIKNNNCDNEGIFYTSKYPLISLGFNAYYHLTKDEFEKINKYENNISDELLKFYYKHNKKEPTIINYECDNFNKNNLEIIMFPKIYKKIIDTIFIKGLRKLRPIDNDNNVVFKIKRAYLHLFNLTYLLFISICSFFNFSSISHNFCIGIIYNYSINNEILKKSLSSIFSLFSFRKVTSINSNCVFKIFFLLYIEF